MTALPKGHTAVMAQRVEPPDSLDFFPTPPWSTRALCEIVLGRPRGQGLAPHKSCQGSCWEPAAGEGHMAEVLSEYFPEGRASDVHDYGKGYAVGSFIGEGPDVTSWKHTGRMVLSDQPDWIITNPPFAKAADFVGCAIEQARVGAAMLLRTAWLESADRYPPSIIAQFVERVPMAKGRWDPDGSTATSYMWFVWQLPIRRGETRFMWIPPGQRQALERPGDRRRFASTHEPMPLFQGTAP